jgi:hypothetical protein
MSKSPDGNIGIEVQGQGEEPKVETPAKLPPPERDNAFQIFKQDKGSDGFRILNENKELLKEKRKVYKDLALKINTTKVDIDRLKIILDKKQLDRANKGFKI